jgi:hypothetical protein
MRKHLQFLIGRGPLDLFDPARRATCPQCGGNALCAEVNVTEDGSPPDDLAANDFGNPEPCPCGNKPMVTRHIYGPAGAGGWRPMLHSSIDWGSVSREALQAAILSVFGKPPDPSELPDDHELTDTELTGGDSDDAWR